MINSDTATFLQKKIHAIGLMSGTSLDGLDICYCSFYYDKTHWKYEIIKAINSKYNLQMRQLLTEAFNCSSRKLTEIHIDFGKYCGLAVNKFIEKEKLKPDFIASHGHTVFHEPEKGINLQIGSGAGIYALTKIPVVCDFRSVDIASGGQGAPLVPIGDLHLFTDYAACINLGGFANISIKKNNNITAFDICPANLILNYLALTKGLQYDKNGQIASQGNIDTSLLTKLNQLEFYRTKAPKSLGIEWFNSAFLPLVKETEISVENAMATCVEHIAMQIAAELINVKGKVLISGGGAHNQFLVSQIRKHSAKNDIVIPNKQLVDYKEALVFAFIGLLRLQNKSNCLSSVTGSISDTIGGCVYGNTGIL
jgi:anhydro-N-acetylmuramic acid kinase